MKAISHFSKVMKELFAYALLLDEFDILTKILGIVHVLFLSLSIYDLSIFFLSLRYFAFIFLNRPPAV